MPGRTKCCTCHAKDLTLQKSTPLRKSAPWPLNISDQHVSCTVPATGNASLQILFKCPTPAIVFASATIPHVLHTFDKVHNPMRLPQKNIYEASNVVRACSVLNMFTYKCASRHNGVHFFDISSSKTCLRLVCFVHFYLEICFAPQRRAFFRHLNFQKWSEPGVFSTF